MYMSVKSFLKAVATLSWQNQFNLLQHSAGNQKDRLSFTVKRAKNKFLIFNDKGKEAAVINNGKTLWNKNWINTLSKATLKNSINNVFLVHRRRVKTILGAYQVFTRDNGENFDYCSLGDSDEVKVGEWAIALGNPRNLISNAQYQPIASAGIVSAINADFSLDSQSGKLLDNMIQTDASLNPGNSGGPLIDSNGDVIGINTFNKADSQNLGFAIPINFAKKIADELKLKGVIDRRVSFGLSATQYIYGKNRDQVGLFIDKVDYSDSAINEELFRGDIIVAVEGYKVESLDEIKAVLIKLDFRAGDKIKLTVVRENDLLDVSLTLGEV